MRILNNIVHLEYSEFVPSIMPKGTFDSAKARGTIVVVGRGGNGNQVLIQYPSLPEKYKEKVSELFGNPFEYVRKQAIKQYLNSDYAARKFYTEYHTEDGKALPTTYIELYTNAANWLNMLVEVQENGKKLLTSLGMTKAEFWEAVSDIIKKEAVELPAAYAKLLEKVRLYKEQGYKALVSKKFGNANSTKVKDDVSMAVLMEMIAHHNQFDDVFIQGKYNELAKVKGYKMLQSATTVANYRKKYEFALAGRRQGNDVWYNKYGKHIKQMRPTAPLLLINSDDNVLDLYFREERVNKNGHSVANYYFRYTLIVVMDAYNDYVLGYAIGETVTEELVKEAYRNAVHHIHELTGNWHLWHQIKTDRWGLKALKPFYEQQATFTPATARVARGKYIEQAFGNTWHNNLKLWNNYSGHNITAKSKLNSQSIEENKKDFPTKEEGIAQISQFIDSMRQVIDTKTQKTRQQNWLEGLQNCPQERKRLIGDTERYLWFGKEHTYSNRITNGGITITIDGCKYEYELSEKDFLVNVGKEVKVLYDPCDMSQVMACADGGRTRLLCHAYEKMPSAIMDFREGDRARLNERINEKKRHVVLIGEMAENRKQILDRERINAESLLQAGVLTKEVRQTAEKRYLGDSGADTDEQYDVMNDI